VHVFIKLIAFVCSGGITCWFAQQSLLIEQMEQMRRSNNLNLEHQQQQEEYRKLNYIDENNEEDEDDDEDFDFGLNDNAEYYHDNDIEDNTMRMNRTITGYNNISSSSGREWHNITVKSFFFYGISISFGSIIQCALLENFVNILENIIAYIDSFMLMCFAPLSSSSSLGRRFGQQRRGFQGMTIADNDEYSRLSIREKIYVFWTKVERRIRMFLMNHNELGLCHVAMYHKSYRRASHDVMTLLNSSGTFF
jgi:hypothetical protein